LPETICILPQINGVGGPASFQSRLIAGLKARDISVHHDPLAPGTGAILVIGGTQQVPDLLRARRRGVRIVQRLNGMNWIHRKRYTGFAHFVRAERNNWLLAYIRRYLADEVVYQSDFARTWWQTMHGSVRSRGKVIYNGVDLNRFTPQNPADRPGAHPQDHVRLLLVEGHLRGGYELGLESAVALDQALNTHAESVSQRSGPGRRVELVVAGDVAPELQQRYTAVPNAWITWAGIVARERVPELDRSADLLFSADLNAACPNSVVEALACGLPVIAFATGALPELVGADAGRVVPYGGNYWNLEPPDIPALAQAAEEVLANPKPFRAAARARAEEAFGLEKMVDQYLEVLLPH
jgi:glycosyltransferase involved in cell wall biosynthesis